VIGLIGISADVTQLKETQRALQIANKKAETANRNKSNFIANLSHDIRAPIAGIVGVIQNLFDDACLVDYRLSQGQLLTLNQQQKLITNIKQDSQLIVTATDELLQLCNEILETINIESGEITEPQSHFNLRQLINNKLDLLQPIAKHNQLTLFSEINDRVPLYFKGLSSYLSRIVLNLLSNALKFTEEGFVKITINCMNSMSFNTGDPIRLCFVVEDSGRGIPVDKFDTIFDNFSRLKASSAKESYKGFGLGLHAVKQYVKAMSGTIKVESKVGKGTRFIFHLPLIVSDHGDVVSKILRLETSKLSPLTQYKKRLDKSYTNDSKIHPSRLSTFQRCVLVVEDNPVATRAMKLSLEAFGCIVDCAQNSKKAIHQIKHNYYDLIFMDIGLPDRSGIDTTKHVRRLLLPWLKKIPIIALTGHTDQGDKCLLAGMQAYMIKPILRHNLKDILEKYAKFYFTQESHTIDTGYQELEDRPLESFPPSSMNKDANKFFLPIVLDWQACLKKQQNNVFRTQQLLKESIGSFNELIKKLKYAYHNLTQQELQLILDECFLKIDQLKLPQLERQFNIFQYLMSHYHHNQSRLNHVFINLESSLNILETLLIQMGMMSSCYEQGLPPK